MATIGQQLLTPDPGYRRYDDNDSRFIYTGTWNYYTDSHATGYYNTTIHSGGAAIGNSVKFNFYGTKLRILPGIVAGRSNNITVKIDNVIIGTMDMTKASGYTAQVLLFEVTNLSLGVHKVEVINNTTNTMDFDIIDIDDTGYLVHPILNQVSSLNNIKLGDCIPCRYTATNGSVGTFSEFGTCIKDEIPVSGTATPDGLFYYIFDGYDNLGRMKLTPDRNLQHSISWDSINSVGMVFGCRIFNSDNNYKFISRLMTGGLSSTDIDNEWDRIIVNSTLGGLITAGDNNIWHWSYILNWMSNTVNGNNTKRVLRGKSTISYYDTATLSSSYGIDVAFRPILIIEKLPKYLIQQGDKYYTINSDYYDLSIHKFIPLTLSGGSNPNESDYFNYGFSNLSQLNTPVTYLTDTFIPIDKLYLGSKVIKHEFTNMIESVEQSKLGYYFLIQNANQLKSTDGTSITYSDSIEYDDIKFNEHGMNSISNIKPNIIYTFPENKYKIALYKVK